MQRPDQDDVVHCPECSGPQVDGLTCWQQLGVILGWEYEDADLRAEHFLTVATYNLQHPAQFTDAALADLRAAFIEHLDNGVAVEELRRRGGRAYTGKKRVLKDEAERIVRPRTWSMTIADVHDAGQPTGAAERVQRWAMVVRNEL